MRILQKIVFFYNKNTLYLGNIRPAYSKKLVHSKQLTFLNLRVTPTSRLTTLLLRDGNYLRLYKFLRQYYILLLRANLLPHTPTKLEAYNFDDKAKKELQQLCKQHVSLYNFDYILLWRLFLIDPLFRLHFIRQQKLKHSQLRITFLPKMRRVFLVWRWIKYFFKSHTTKLAPVNTTHGGLQHFITAPQEKHILTLLKLQSYRLYLTRLGQ